MPQQSNSLQKSQQMRAMNKLYKLSHQELFECVKQLLSVTAERVLKDGGYRVQLKVFTSKNLPIKRKCSQYLSCLP